MVSTNLDDQIMTFQECETTIFYVDALNKQINPNKQIKYLVKIFIFLLLFTVSTTMATTAALLQTIGFGTMLPDTALLGRWQLGPLLGQIVDKWNLKVIVVVIMCLEASRGTTANASNIELLVDLVVGDLMH